MLTAFVAIAVLGQAAAPLKTKDFWPLAERLGYPSSGVTLNDNGYGALKIGGFDVETSLARNEEGIVSGVNLRFHYQASHVISPRFLLSWLGSRYEYRQPAVGATTGLDGNLWMRLEFPLRTPQEMEALKTNLSDFGYAISSLQEEVPPAKTPWTAKVDENQVVDCLDSGDMGFLVEQWHWQYRGPFGFSSPVILTPADIDGFLIVISNPHPGRLIRDHVQISAGKTWPKGAVTDALAAELKKKLAPIVVEWDGDNLRFFRDIDLSGGVKLGKLKAEWKSFADKVAPYVKEDPKKTS